jgi:plasmid maintenance system antidote protein VapI
MSKRELARGLELHYTSLFGVLNGTRTLTISQVILLISKYDISAEWLFRGVGSMFFEKNAKLDAAIERFKKDIMEIEKAGI